MEDWHEGELRPARALRTPNSFWTRHPGAAEDAARMAREGRSSRETAAFLREAYGEPVTRNAVLGRMQRQGVGFKTPEPFGLGPRPRSAQRGRHVRPMLQPARALLARVARPALRSTSSPTPAVPAPLQGPPRTFLELRHCDCRWIVSGDPRVTGIDGVLYCAAPALPGGSWCAAHGALAVRPDQPRGVQGGWGKRY